MLRNGLQIGSSSKKNWKCFLFCFKLCLVHFMRVDGNCKSSLDDLKRVQSNAFLCCDPEQQVFCHLQQKMLTLHFDPWVLDWVTYMYPQKCSLYEHQTMHFDRVAGGCFVFCWNEYYCTTTVPALTNMKYLLSCFNLNCFKYLYHCEMFFIYSLMSKYSLLLASEHKSELEVWSDSLDMRLFYSSNSYLNPFFFFKRIVILADRLVILGENFVNECSGLAPYVYAADVWLFKGW